MPIDAREGERGGKKPHVFSEGFIGRGFRGPESGLREREREREREIGGESDMLWSEIDGSKGRGIDGG